MYNGYTMQTFCSCLELKIQDRKSNETISRERRNFQKRDDFYRILPTLTYNKHYFV